MADRGQVVVVDFAVAGMPKKIRPVLIVQSDIYNRKMTNIIVAMIMTNLARGSEPSHYLIDITTSEGSGAGLLFTSVVNCDTLTTVRQDDILRVLGSLSPAAMQHIDNCLRAALGLP